MDEPQLDAGTLESLTDPAEVEALGGWLDENLERETELLLFMTPDCHVCPHQLRSVATLALASDRVSLEVVDATRETELAERYEVRTVPTTVVDDELILDGVVPPGELALRIVERQSPAAQLRVFTALVDAERYTGAAERLVDGRAGEAFLHLWATGSPEQRAGLLQVVDEAVQYDPEALDGLLPAFLTALAPGGAWLADDGLRADSAGLLGRIAHADARPVLERLARDPCTEVADAAGTALEFLGD